MLSKRLTFSLVFVLMLALVAGPALAQVTVSDPAITSATIAKEGFAVYQMNLTSAATPLDADYNNGITVITPVSADANGAGVAADMPNLYDLLRLGGSIELALSVGPKTVADDTNQPTDADSDPDPNLNNTIVSDGDTPAAITADKAASFAYRLLITEVMWGLDLFQPGAAKALPQWVEIYNRGDALKAASTVTGTGDSVILIFHAASRPDRVGEKITIGATQTDNTDLAGTYVVVDQLSTLNRFGGAWALPGNSGNTVALEDGTPPTDIVSMYRKINLSAGKYKAKADAKITNPKTGRALNSHLDGLGDGAEAGSWAASTGRVNMTGRFIGSPGSVHITLGGAGGIRQGFAINPATIASTGVIINEVRNDSSDANLDWIELYHFNDEAGATPQNLENWTLSIVTGTKKAAPDDAMYETSGDKNFKDTNLFHLPKYKLQPGEYLVIYNRHPSDTILAGGVNVEDVIAGKQVNKGASHQYIVEEGLDLPSDKKFLLILRNNHEKAGTHEKIVDYAGNGFFKRLETNKFNTDVWPFIAWKAPGDPEDVGAMTFASTGMSYGRGVALNDKGMWRPKSRADNRTHKDDWMSFGFTGTGYDRDVDHASAPGTPGYENRVVNVIHDDRENATGKSPYDFGGTITISEVMYDAGPRWNLIQWIELYNSSMMETVDISGWTMEIRNESTDVQSYVDSSFKFEANTEILPNQTLLIVSGTGANDVPKERVYNLYEHHRQRLGLVARDSRLLSREGFYIRLTAKVMKDGRELDIDDLDNRRGLTLAEILMDEVGNIEVDGAARNHMWDLPERDPAARQSLIRIYGSREIDGTSDMASDGLMETSWDQSDISGAALTFYGHRNDIGTPGYRLGGPLPVTLSKFRPVRNQTTGHVDITWITQSELNNAGFNILRAESKTGDFKVVNVKGIIAGHGTTSEKHVYTFTDTTAKPNIVYYYQIEDVSINGQRTTLTTTHLRGHVGAAGKLTTTWGDLKHIQ